MKRGGMYEWKIKTTDLVLSLRLISFSSHQRSAPDPGLHSSSHISTSWFFPFQGACRMQYTAPCAFSFLLLTKLAPHPPPFYKGFVAEHLALDNLQLSSPSNTESASTWPEQSYLAPGIIYLTFLWWCRKPTIPKWQTNLPVPKWNYNTYALKLRAVFIYSTYMNILLKDLVFLKIGFHRGLAEHSMYVQFHPGVLAEVRKLDFFCSYIFYNPLWILTTAERIRNILSLMELHNPPTKTLSLWRNGRASSRSKVTTNIY